ncbi:MAG: hypothetical protein D6677_06815, partial [Calditrichaeota bacterium]
MRFLLFLLLPLALMRAGAYQYNYQNQLYTLKEEGNGLALVLQAQADPRVVEQQARQTLGGLLQKMEALHQPDNRRLLLTRKIPSAELEGYRQALMRLPGVRLVMPVFINKRTRLTATDRFIVRLQPGMDAAQRATLFRRQGARVVRRIYGETWLLRSDSLDAFEAAERFGELPRVLWAQPNFIYLDHTILNSNDTYYAQQWAHKNTGQKVANGSETPWPTSVSGFDDADMDVPEAWDLLRQNGLQRGAGVLIGVIDSGIELAHPDLADNIVDPGRDFTPDNQNDGNDIQGHGTAVSGVLAAQADNGIGVAGIAPDAGLLPVKINSTWGSADDAGIAEAIDYAWQYGCDVLSNSWSGTAYSQVIADAINRAKTKGRDGKGCVVVFSSGNEGHGVVSFPAQLGDVIAVGASNMFDEKKNQGSRDLNRKWGGNYGPELDMVAPSIVYTTDLKGEAGFNNGDYDDTFGGTSASCPHVSATAALVLGADPNLTSDQVQDILQKSCDKIDRYIPDAQGWNKHTGYGRVNARRAVERALNSGGDVPYFVFTKPVSGTDTGDRIFDVDIHDGDGIDNAQLFYRADYNGGTGSWKSVTGKAQGGNRYQFNLPGQKWETVVSYYFYARDKQGNAVTFPIGGDDQTPPPLPFVFHVAELQSQQYVSKDVPVSIDKSNVFYTSQLTVNDDVNMVDVNATVSINGQVQDFAIALEAPDQVGSGILQVNPGTAYDQTTVDDEAKTAITDGSAPYSGSYQPDNALWVFDGRSSLGDWRLTVYDDIYYNNGGTLTDWSVDITSMKDNPVPVVSDIPDQTIDQGQNFTQIDLNLYVTDGNHSDSEISWQYSGNSALTVTIDNQNIATVQAPDSQWSGSETITFTASDPGAATDNDPAVFTVNSINEPPVVGNIPDQSVSEGQGFATIALDDYVSDVDNADSEMNWTY